MKKIDTSTWKEFKISDLFDVKNSKSISDKRGLDFDENNPYDFIGRTPVNNGVQGKIVKQDFEPNNENTFSVTQIGEKLCLFRDNKWYACQNIFLLTPLYPELITAKFFICCIVTKTLKVVFGEDAYSSYPTKDTLSDMIVKLPATSDGQPDWNYMESYMKAVMKESEASLENLKQADEKKHAVDASGWKIFRVEELFETEKVGRKIQVPTGSWIASKNLVPGSTPRITVSGVNNGITGYYNDVDDANYRIYKNFISVSFLGTVFYQAGRASLDMKVHCLKPLNIELNERVASFLITIIKTALGGIKYSDQISSTVLPNLELRLPVDASGKPDWAYMDEYMRTVMERTKSDLLAMQSIS